MREPASFGARLKRQREQCGVSLRSIADSTKVSASYYAALERGDCSRWPAGVYSRAFIRGYAEAIALDPDTVASDFFHCFPELSVPAHPVSAAVRSPEATKPAIATIRTEMRLALAESPGDRARERATTLLRVLTEIGAMLVLAAIVGVANGQFWMALAIALVTRHIVGALTDAPATELLTLTKEEVETSPAPLPNAEPVG